MLASKEVKIKGSLAHIFSQGSAANRFSRLGLFIRIRFQCLNPEQVLRLSDYVCIQPSAGSEHKWSLVELTQSNLHKEKKQIGKKKREKKEKIPETIVQCFRKVHIDLNSEEK